MTAQPLVMPEIFSEETSRDRWINHFGNVAVVNKWDETARLCWLKVCFTGGVNAALQSFPNEVTLD